MSKQNSNLPAKRLATPRLREVLNDPYCKRKHSSTPFTSADRNCGGKVPFAREKHGGEVGAAANGKTAPVIRAVQSQSTRTAMPQPPPSPANERLRGLASFPAEFDPWPCRSKSMCLGLFFSFPPICLSVIHTPTFLFSPAACSVR